MPKREAENRIYLDWRTIWTRVGNTSQNRGSYFRSSPGLKKNLGLAALCKPHHYFSFGVFILHTVVLTKAVMVRSTSSNYQTVIGQWQNGYFTRWHGVKKLSRLSRWVSTKCQRFVQFQIIRCHFNVHKTSGLFNVLVSCRHGLYVTSLQFHSVFIIISPRLHGKVVPEMEGKAHL